MSKNKYVVVVFIIVAVGVVVVAISGTLSWSNNLP